VLKMPRPVLLSAVDGKNFILGTFDTTSFKDWWKSEPFPGSIEDIGEPIHIYGQYHVCIVKKTDGTYSIYRTRNAGKSWIEVYNTSYIIYTLAMIDYGWVIGSTSHGWIESRIDSGYTWSEISTFAPNCKTIINIDDDVLFAHDGRKIWRSTDFAHTWSKVLDSARWTSEPYHWGESSSRDFSWNSDSYPAIAGANQSILVGFGPYLVISTDVGKTWFTHINGWTGENWDIDGWGGDGEFGPQFGTRILQLTLTSVDGFTLEDLSFIARTTNNSGYVRYIYSGPLYYWYDTSPKKTGYGWKYIFSLPFANYEQGKVSAYDVLTPGSPEHDIFATVCSYDSNNKAIIKYSTNGGYSWSTINSSNVVVYEGDPTQEIVSGLGQQVFDEEYFTRSVWVGQPCHNSGRYKIYYNKAVRGISADFDLLTGFTKTESYGSDMVTYITYEDTCDFDILNKVSIYEYVPSDMLLKDTVSIFHLPDILMEKEFPISFDMDILNAARKISELDIDSLVQKTCFPEMYPRMYLIGPNEKSYGMETKIVDNYIDEIMNSVERYTIQLPDIHYPDIPYKPVDFRTDGVTL